MKYILCLLCLFMLTSCRATTNSNTDDIMHANLVTGLSCPAVGSDASARWIRDAESLRQLLKGTQQMIGKEIALPAFDFQQRRLLLVSMGQKPNPGYRLELLDENLQRQGTDWVLRLRWKQPEPGRMYAMVITYPCLWLEMPKLTNAGIRIVDEQDQQRLYLPAKK